MAVHIRMQRFGAKKKPFYRIVVTDSRSKRDGAFLEQVGTYDPMKNPSEIKLVVDRIAYWMSVGAKASETAASLIRRHQRESAAAAT